jgi:phosphopantothenoylcysteine decarboxylase / phosphopantothenate---cysteine ligase
MNIVLGVTGGIAAYKTPELVRQLKSQGADVQIVMTASAGEFVTETALQAVSGHPIRSNLWDKEAEASMSHIDLARWADVVLIAPATAEIMARLAGGAAPDLLTTLCLATEAPIAIAPAMNHVMWNNAAVQANRATLEGRGIAIIGPDYGSQACGETGAGRMTEPEEIAAIVTAPGFHGAAGEGLLAGKTVLVTAGPTREAIDPVRYISNRSSGRMGFAVAAAAAEAGAQVTLVSGPVSLEAPSHVERINVETAQAMYERVLELAAGIDIFISVAAVADYRPASVAEQKIKKSTDTMSLELQRNPDILAAVAALPGGPFTVGFAAETEELESHARGKLEAKGLDMIAANEVGSRLGFETEDNALQVFWKGGSVTLARTGKNRLARQLIATLAERFTISRKRDNVVNIMEPHAKDSA